MDQKKRPRPTMKFCFIMSAPEWNSLGANGQSKARKIFISQINLFIPDNPVGGPRSSDKIVSVTGSSEAIIQYVYNICGITLMVVYNISVLYIGCISIHL
jgi:hypothetical protein